MIGFLRVSIVLIIWIVSAVSFFGLLEMFFTFLYKYDLDAFVESFLIVFLQLVFGILGVFFGYFWVSGVPWGSFWQACWVPGGPRDTILAPKVSFGGSEGPSWTAGGSRGGLHGEKVISLPHFGFWDHFGIKNH